jgi:dTDP-4-dehydrorhamnose reductase
MKAIVIGSQGMLGSDLALELTSRGHEAAGLDLPDFDLTNPDDSARIAAGAFAERVDVVFNCAAYTAVDRAEVERDRATMVNGIGPGYLAQSCAMAGLRLIHIGTDFVFDGLKSDPYTEEDTPNPIGAYGESKLQGERAVLALGGTVVRTAWLYGPNGQSFPRTMIRAWLAEKPLAVVADQIGTPTYTADLAKVLAQVAENAVPPGLYHAAGPEAMTWHELAKRAISRYRDDVLKSDRPIVIEPIRTEDWPTPARRPSYSALSSEKLRSVGIGPMRDADESLAEFVVRLEAP